MTVKSLMWLGLDLLYGLILSLSIVSFLKNTTGSILIIKHKDYNDVIIMLAFWDLFQISLDIFQEFDLDNLISKKPVLVKKKVY